MSAFSTRHIGPSEAEKSAMLEKIGVTSIEELVEKTIPTGIRLAKDLTVSDALTEKEYLDHIAEIAAKNKVFK